MANLFTRIKDTVVADLNEVLDQKEQKNPLAHINEYVRQCEREAQKIRTLVEKQYRLKQEFTREFNQVKAMADKRKRQAKLAQEANEQELYEHAHAEQVQFEERANKLEEIRQKAMKDLDELETKYAQMKYKIKDLHMKRVELKGRENVARAHKSLNQVLYADLNAGKSSAKFAELEDYIEQLERQVSSNYRMHTLDARLAELEKNSTSTL
ncbi:PspA/IM30 family protein [Radiobacillus sp. PE A8.2]|uniref:PspA/IM30 family protein n=1 Tax=Radiobacillus sp. PE A8.2 TaxID=3380349 RepID=UPI00388FEC8B